MLTRVRILFVSLFLLFTITGTAAGYIPVPIDSVDLSKIPHKKIRELLSVQKHFGITNFNEISPACITHADSGEYRTFLHSQVIRQNVSVVWKNITERPLSEIFNGHIVSLGLWYSSLSNNLHYRNEKQSGLEEGQIIFFNLRVLSGIKNVAVALEVTRMDTSSRTLEYCYVDHGNTRGTQQITLQPLPDGSTRITQMTLYKCNSHLSYRKFYSYFHGRIVKEFFYNLRLRSEHEPELQFYTAKQ
jgi:hypothetical protein